MEGTSGLLRAGRLDSSSFSAVAGSRVSPRGPRLHAAHASHLRPSERCPSAPSRTELTLRSLSACLLDDSSLVPQDPMRIFQDARSHRRRPCQRQLPPPLFFQSGPVVVLCLAQHFLRGF